MVLILQVFARTDNLLLNSAETWAMPSTCQGLCPVRWHLPLMSVHLFAFFKDIIWPFLKQQE